MVSCGITQAIGASATSQVQSDHEMMGTDEEEESDDGSVGGWSDDEVDTDGDSQMVLPGCSDNSEAHAAARKAAVEALRTDIKAAKQAGFRVGVLGDYKTGGMELYVSIAIRVSKLGISDEAMSAWKLDRTKYFVVLMHYTQGYKGLDKLTRDIGYHTRRGVEICVGVHARYKPTIQQAIAAFSKVRYEGDGDHVIATKDGLETESQAAEEKDPQLESMFLSGPLHELLNTRLAQLLKYRMDFGFSWDGAELYYNGVSFCDIFCHLR